MKLYRNIAIALVCVILGIMLAWQYKSINYNNERAIYENKNVKQLQEELLAENKKIDDLRKRNEELLNENSKLGNIQGNTTEETKALKEKLDFAKMVAGLVTVRGRGIIITLDNGDNSFIDDYHILRMLNELKASGAQAISINDERIVAMSEVRLAGKYVMVNGIQMLPPFSIKAIASPDKLEHSLQIIGGVVEEYQTYDLKVTLEKSDNIIIPKVRDDGTVIKTDTLTEVK